MSIILCALVFSACNSERIIESEPPRSTVGLENLFGKWPSNKVQNNTLPFVISDEFKPSEAQTIENMAINWQNAMNNDVTFFDNQLQIVEGVDEKSNYTSLSQFNDSEMGIYKSTTWFSGASPFALAITQFFGVRRNAGSPVEYIELVHADIMMNYRDFSFSEDLSVGTYDFASVVLHEVGHFLGLPHAGYFVESVMTPSIRRQLARRDLFIYDETSIRENYDLPAAGGGQNAITGDAGVAGPAHPNEGEPVHGIIELRSDWSCHHIINGKTVHVH